VNAEAQKGFMTHTVLPVVPVSEACGLGRVRSFPVYNRSELACSIGHLGLGNFHRAHQALYMHKLMLQRPQDLMIHGVAM